MPTVTAGASARATARANAEREGEPDATGPPTVTARPMGRGVAVPLQRLPGRARAITRPRGFSRRSDLCGVCDHVPRTVLPL